MTFVRLDDEQDRHDVEQQDVLDHVHGEGLLAEPVDGRDERGDEGEQARSEGEQADDGRGARAVLGAHAAPARYVRHRGQTHERQGAGVERPRSVRSHCAGLSQSRGRDVTRRAPASAGAHRRPQSARRPRLGARPTSVLGLRRERGGRPAAVLGLPGAAALPARRALPALRAAGALPRALLVAGRRAGAGVGAGRLRGSRAGARARAEVPRRPRRGRCDGGPDRRRRSGRDCSRRRPRSCPSPPIRCAAACAASTMPTAWPPRSGSARASR